ncbi:5'/3'-nucleotidase SurE [soil metagenome]
MALLVTNDDGISAPGIAALAGALADAGHDLVVAAPLVDMSGCGAAIGQVHLDNHIDVRPAIIAGYPDVRAFGVDGPPALAVMTAHLGGFGEPPELVVSGINPGPNTGRSTLHSGTVGAALTAANFGMSGLAVSIDVGAEIHWATATTLARSALRWLLEAPVGTVLNLNVPNCALSEVRGVRWAALAPFGSVRSAVVESDDGRLQMELRDIDEELPTDSDTALVAAGYAAITSVVGIRPAERVPVAEIIEHDALRRIA